MRYHQYLKSPIGYIKVVANDKQVLRLSILKGDTVGSDKKNHLTQEVIEQLKDYFYKDAKKFDLPYEIKGSKFVKSVYAEVLKIPYASTLTYTEVAEKLGDPDKASAVGKVVAKNKLPVIIPCHRVIKSTGDAGTSSYGQDKKQWLIDFEESYKWFNCLGWIMTYNREFKRMVAGELYNASNKELKKLYDAGQHFRYEFSNTKPNEHSKREKMIREVFGSVGANVRIMPPLHVDYGCNIYIGDNFYANYDCIFLDVCPIIIGNNVMFGPRVEIYTATHPLDAEARNSQLESGKKVIIGNNVWVGGSVVIVPGVTIGDNTVIGAGSVVTKDIPSNVVAAGNPAKVIRKLDESDKIYWRKQIEQYYKDKAKENDEWNAYVTIRLF